jgi:hypothetical protein
VAAAELPHLDLYVAFADAAADWARQRGMNTLETICADLRLGGKSGNGAQMPRLWQQGRVAEVYNHAMQDVLMTRRLLEHVCQRQGRVERRGRTLYLPYISVALGMPALLKPTAQGTF